MGCYNNVKKQYLITFFYSLIPAYVIERLFWQERGVNVQMVVCCEIIYALTVTLLEIPSGILADKFGRKKLLALNGVLSVLELVLLVFANSFWQFAAAVFLAGIGKAFASGSGNALLYDSLLSENREADFEKLLGRLSAAELSGYIIAALSGGVLASLFNYEFNYYVSIVSVCLAFFVTLSLREPPLMTKPGTEMSGFLHYAKQAAVLFLSKPLLVLYSLTGAVLGGCLIYLDEFWQIALENIGVPVLFFGGVSTLIMIIRIPGNLLAYRLKGRLRQGKVTAFIILINAAGYVLIFFTRNILCLVPMALICLTAGIAEPLVAGYLHHNTESRVRATMESFYSLGLRVVSVGAGLLFGYISAGHSVFAGFLALGGVCLGYLALFAVVLSRYKLMREKMLQKGAEK